MAVTVPKESELEASVQCWEGPGTPGYADSGNQTLEEIVPSRLRSSVIRCLT
jgi:hypothetical protein